MSHLFSLLHVLILVQEERATREATEARCAEAQAEMARQAADAAETLRAEQAAAAHARSELEAELTGTRKDLERERTAVEAARAQLGAERIGAQQRQAAWERQRAEIEVSNLCFRGIKMCMALQGNGQAG